ncbi:hypothetical protein [Pleionea sp. CnH1-48]|uniref:hypothetical protein n=1 Tax=Pleionea sp. CnH1-48 TaxID=2954494 RepID=UPI0020980741|nr:hypothetical protein [Pleionea sp. CnH1-48]MCO7224500.1 hypothetical protein [Pleionea sp. CnH1-48]
MMKSKNISRVELLACRLSTVIPSFLLMLLLVPKNAIRYHKAKSACSLEHKLSGGIIGTPILSPKHRTNNTHNTSPTAFSSSQRFLRRIRNQADTENTRSEESR